MSESIKGRASRRYSSVFHRLGAAEFAGMNEPIKVFCMDMDSIGAEHKINQEFTNTHTFMPPAFDNVELRIQFCWSEVWMVLYEARWIFIISG